MQFALLQERDQGCIGRAHAPVNKVGIPNFVSGPREYIMEGEYVILAMCSWFRIR